MREAEVRVQVIFLDSIFLVERALGHGALFVQRDGYFVVVAPQRSDFLDSAGVALFFYALMTITHTKPPLNIVKCGAENGI